MARGHGEEARPLQPLGQLAGLGVVGRRASSTWPRRAAISLSPIGTSGHMPARFAGSTSEKRSSARSSVSVAWVSWPLSIMTSPAIRVALASSTVEPSTMATA